jgi:hypothetical protein
MWIRSILTTSFALGCVLPMSAVAQDEPPMADFATVREQFVDGQTRLAAQTLLRSTLYIRHQVGRSKDEVVGMQLLTTEGQLEKLASAMGNGRSTGLRDLERALVQADRLLALHFVQTAGFALVRPRVDELPGVARDMKRGAAHFERSFTLVGKAVASEAAVLLADVRSVATEMETTRRVPSNTKTVLAAFERQLTGVAVLAVSQR